MQYVFRESSAHRNFIQSFKPAAMFNLNDSLHYLLYNRPTDMRKSFHTLSGIVTDVMGHDPCNGNVYIFMNRARNRIKLLHWKQVEWYSIPNFWRPVHLASPAPLVITTSAKG